jgi:hypothetical protein
MTAAEYPESLVGILLQTALSLMDFPRFRYWIEPITTREEGDKAYDAELKLKLYTFYMQFKRPTVVSSGQIISERAKLVGHPQSTALYFDLRKDPKTKQYNQHNALFKLNDGTNRAAYVCPTFLEASSYQAGIQRTMWLSLLNLVGFRRHRFLTKASVIVHSQSPAITFSDVPVFKHHVTIPPHKMITDTARHRYSFDSNAQNVCFHDPERVTSYHLDDWLQSVYRDSAREQFAVDDRQNLVGVIRSLGPYGEGFSVPETVSFETWKLFGDYLEENLGIYQFGILRSSLD